MMSEATRKLRDTERIDSKRIADFEIKHDDAPGGTIEADGIGVAHTRFDAVFIGKGRSTLLAAENALEQLAQSIAVSDNWAQTQIEASIGDLDGDESTEDMSAAILIRFGYPESREEALARHLDIPADDVSEGYYGENNFDAGGLGDYLVLTDAEADEAAEDSCDNYIDDCLDIPTEIEPYFDRAAWIKDAIDTDGRGHLLSSYDSGEIDIVGPDGETFYVFRTN